MSKQITALQLKESKLDLRLGKARNLHTVQLGIDPQPIFYSMDLEGCEVFIREFPAALTRYNQMLLDQTGLPPCSPEMFLSLCEQKTFHQTWAKNLPMVSY